MAKRRLDAVSGGGDTDWLRLLSSPPSRSVRPGGGSGGGDFSGLWGHGLGVAAAAPTATAAPASPMGVEGAGGSAGAAVFVGVKLCCDGLGVAPPSNGPRLRGVMVEGREADGAGEDAAGLPALSFRASDTGVGSRKPLCSQGLGVPGSILSECFTFAIASL